MSTVINQDYSAYYKSTQNVKKYASNKTDQKAAASQHGIVMGATSKYGDDAVVEFSRGGMAALEESRQDIAESGSLSGRRRSFDEIMREHTQEVADQLDEYVRSFTRTGDKSNLLKFSRVALDWLHENYSKHPEWFGEKGSSQISAETGNQKSEVKWGSLPDGRKSHIDIMREHSPEVAGQLDEYARSFTRTGDKSYLLKFSRVALDWLHENYPEHPEWFSEDSSTISTKTESAEKSTSTITAGEAGLSKRAQEFLKKLRNTYGDMEFFVADFNKGDKAKDILFGATKEFSVILSSEELEKMASDEKYAAEYMQRIQGAVRMSERINQEFGFTSAFGETANSAKISKIAISFNQDGTTSFFAELEKSSRQQRERIEKAWEEKRAEKKEQEKRAERDKQVERTTVQADSLEELLEIIRKADWNKAV